MTIDRAHQEQQLEQEVLAALNATPTRSADAPALVYTLAGVMVGVCVLPALERLEAQGRVRRVQVGDRLARWEATM